MASFRKHNAAAGAVQVMVEDIETHLLNKKDLLAQHFAQVRR